MEQILIIPLILNRTVPTMELNISKGKFMIKWNVVGTYQNILVYYAKSSEEFWLIESNVDVIQVPGGELSGAELHRWRCFCLDGPTPLQAAAQRRPSRHGRTLSNIHVLIRISEALNTGLPHPTEHHRTSKDIFSQIQGPKLVQSDLKARCTVFPSNQTSQLGVKPKKCCMLYYPRFSLNIITSILD